MARVTWEILQSRCYTPYSDRNDVCIVEGKSGTFYPGVRIENDSFPLTMDAVQLAFFSCLSEGDEAVSLLLRDADIVKSKPSPSQMEMITIPANSISEWCERFSINPKPILLPITNNNYHFFESSEREFSFKRLQELTSRCHVPNSDFPVTALIQTDIGIFSGVNIEMNDWQKGLCAERVALGKARSAGATTFGKIHLYAPKNDYISPCGACRQVLTEWMAEGSITLVHNEFESTRLLIADLLPYQLKTGIVLKKNH